MGLYMTCVYLLCIIQRNFAHMALKNQGITHYGGNRNNTDMQSSMELQTMVTADQKTKIVCERLYSSFTELSTCGVNEIKQCISC